MRAKLPLITVILSKATLPITSKSLGLHFFAQGQLSAEESPVMIE